MSLRRPQTDQKRRKGKKDHPYSPHAGSPAAGNACVTHFWRHCAAAVAYGIRTPEPRSLPPSAPHLPPPPSSSSAAAAAVQGQVLPYTPSSLWNRRRRCQRREKCRRLFLLPATTTTARKKMRCLFCLVQNKRNNKIKKAGIIVARKRRLVALRSSVGMKCNRKSRS